MACLYEAIGRGDRSRDRSPRSVACMFTRYDRHGDRSRDRSRRSIARPIAASDRRDDRTVYQHTCDRRGDQSARSSCGFNVSIY